MAATVTMTRQKISGGEVKISGTLTLGTYVTGGVAVTANDFKLGDGNFDVKLFPTTTGHIAGYDKANKKIKSYTQGITTGATPAGALSNGAFAVDGTGAETAVRYSATIASTVYKFGPLLEVTTAMDLSAVVFDFEAIGAY